MNYDIRRISNYIPEIHSRYFADTNGSIYTSLAPNVHKIMVDGERVYLHSFIKNNLRNLNTTDKQIIRIPCAKAYFLLYDGTILQRLKTNIDDTDKVNVRLVGVIDRKCYIVARVIASVFIGPIDGKEVHHIDGDRRNNSVDNLRLMTFEEHRGKGNHKLNHSL